MKKIIIGKKDKADFPELGLKNIAIKVDTGAYTSSIHCHEIEVVKINDKEELNFTLLDPSHPQYDNKKFKTKNFYEKRIKNSFGQTEKRFVIETDIKLFGKKYAIELSLSERGKMKFPILIGRKFLNKKFIVDPSKHDLSFKQKQIESK